MLKISKLTLCSLALVWATQALAQTPSPSPASTTTDALDEGPEFNTGLKAIGPTAAAETIGVSAITQRKKP